jgi:glycosyltransferase involved in cell wall biosynthesis
MPAISVIIPCYNVEDYLRECLDSVINQIHIPVEIICIDDASSDGTLKILEEYKAKYPGLLAILSNTQNKGASYSRNRGIEIAKGDYIQFLDADDLLLPGKLKQQHDMIIACEEPVLLVGNYIRKLKNGEMTRKDFTGIDPWIGLINSSLGCTCSNLWPKKALREVGGWDETLKSSQEYNLMFRLLKINVRVLNDSGYNTIIRERQSGSISQMNLGDNWKRFIGLRLKIYYFLKEEKKLNSRIEKIILQRVFEAIRGLYKYDPREAVSIYREHIHKRYNPSPSVAVTSKYLLLYKWLGFERAEKIKTVFDNFSWK